MTYVQFHNNEIDFIIKLLRLDLNRCMKKVYTTCSTKCEIQLQFKNDTERVVNS